jgi:hypothetical protein
MLRNKHGWYLQHHELYPLLGIEGSILPKEGFGPRVVQGVTFICRPAGTDGRRSPHRLFYLCKECDRLIPFGRAFQHKQGRKHREASNAGHS